MIIKIDDELCPDKILKIIYDFLKSNHPIGKDKAISLMITDIKDEIKIEKITEK